MNNELCFCNCFDIIKRILLLPILFGVESRVLSLAATTLTSPVQTSLEELHQICNSSQILNLKILIQNSKY